jgi:hypothetical protein
MQGGRLRVVYTDDVCLASRCEHDVFMSTQRNLDQ